jgi:hypothetical protein
MDRFHEFQLSYIDDLLEFASECKFEISEVEIRWVKELRNTAMHGHNAVEGQKGETILIFNEHGLRNLFDKIKKLYDLHLKVLHAIEQIGHIRKLKKEKNSFYLKSAMVHNEEAESVSLTHLLSNT